MYGLRRFFLALMMDTHLRSLDGVVRARSWVTGTVSVHSHPGDNNFAVERLELDLLGLETSMTFISPGRSRHCFACLTRRIAPLSSSPVTTDEQHIFLAKSILLTESTIQAASHHGDECTVYPFSVFLPGALPPTMEHWDEKDGSNCSVSYRLTATAFISLIRDAAADTGSTIQTRTARASRVLYVIGEAPSTVSYPLTTSPTSFPIKHGMLHRGRIIVVVHAENTHLSKGNFICFALAITNKYQCDVDYIEVTFVEKICHGGTATKDSVRHGKEIDGLYLKNHTAVLRSNVSWLPEETHSEQHDTRVGAFHWNEVQPATAAEFYKMEDLMHILERNRMRVLVPPESRTSSAGKLIHISHYIQIKVVVQDTPIHCYPTLTIPVTVFDQPLMTTCMKHNAVLGGFALS
jgi:hypothetical protein